MKIGQNRDNVTPEMSRFCVGTRRDPDPRPVRPVTRRPTAPTAMPDLPEPWLRGPVAGVAPVFQPVAHALQHAVEDVGAALAAFPDAGLDARPAGVASVGFHLRHIAGVLDRMATYARAEALSDRQFAALAAEAEPGRESAADLVAGVEAAAAAFEACLAATDPATAFEARPVGRQALPSTVLGLLVHAAEHTQRHVGQLLVTARVVERGA